MQQHIAGLQNLLTSSSLSNIDQEKANIDADALSRIPIEKIMADCTETTTPNIIQNVTNISITTPEPESTWISALTTDVNLLEYDLNQIQSLNFNQISPNDFRAAQTSDATIHTVMEYKRRGRFPSKAERTYETHNVKLLMREWKNLYLDSGDGSPRK